MLQVFYAVAIYSGSWYLLVGSCASARSKLGSVPTAVSTAPTAVPTTAHIMAPMSNEKLGQELVC